MDYRIVSDSSCDLTKELENEMRVLLVPFKISIDEKEYIDEDGINLEEFMLDMENSPNPIVTSCPSPYDYLEKLNMCEEDNIVILTISAKLSGSNNAAQIAKAEYEKEYPNKKVAVIDSKSASAGQVSLLLKINNIMKKDLSFEDKITQIEKAADENNTFFILEQFDNLIKNGRMKKATGIIANALKIRPIMKSDDGEIIIHEINRGFKKSLLKLAQEVGNFADNIEETILVISHADAMEKAMLFSEKVKELYKFKDILIVGTKGLATGYAERGGIVVGL